MAPVACSPVQLPSLLCVWLVCRCFILAFILLLSFPVAPGACSVSDYSSLLYFLFSFFLSVDRWLVIVHSTFAKPAFPYSRDKLINSSTHYYQTFYSKLLFTASFLLVELLIWLLFRCFCVFLLSSFIIVFIVMLLPCHDNAATFCWPLLLQGPLHPAAAACLRACTALRLCLPLSPTAQVSH